MDKYENEDSGVVQCNVGSDFITIDFKSGASYTYTVGSAGATHIANMRKLATDGVGLNTYINKHNPKFQKSSK